MARIAGVDLPKDKRVDVALRYIYGIGPYLASKIVAQSNVDPSVRVKDLREDEVARIRELIAANTWPDKWSGDEPVGEVSMEQTCSLPFFQDCAEGPP